MPKYAREYGKVLGSLSHAENREVPGRVRKNLDSESRIILRFWEQTLKREQPRWCWVGG